jgi:hypothetical protein
MLTASDIKQANERAAKQLREDPHIVEAHYDAKIGRVILALSSGAWFYFRPEDAEGLDGATAAQLKLIEITPSTFSIYFPLLDAHLSLPAMIRGNFGSRKWMAQRLGAVGGSVRSKAKSTAARANGKLGGRPRKTAIG